jgi:hypothetical protein
VIAKHGGRLIHVVTDDSTGALFVAVDGVRVRGRSFIFERDAVEFARTHIDQEVTQ